MQLADILHSPRGRWIDRWPGLPASFHLTRWFLTIHWIVFGKDSLLNTELLYSTIVLYSNPIFLGLIIMTWALCFLELFLTYRNSISTRSGSLLANRWCRVDRNKSQPDFTLRTPHWVVLIEEFSLRSPQWTRSCVDFKRRCSTGLHHRNSNYYQLHRTVCTGHSDQVNAVRMNRIAGRIPQGMSGESWCWTIAIVPY